MPAAPGREAPPLVEVTAASVEFFDRRLASPLVLSSGVIDSVVEARATVTASVAGRETIGRGAIYLSDLWAWPGPSESRAARAAALRSVCRELAAQLPRFLGGGPAHPLEFGLRLHAAAVEPSGAVGADREAARAAFLGPLAEPLPPLARLLCGSPFDAALHDAAGRAHGRSAFRLYDVATPIPTADRLLPGGACRAIREVLRDSPRRVFPATLVVGPRDALDEHLDAWVAGRGYRRVKLKISGVDSAEDAALTSRVVHGLVRRGVESPRVILDANEAYREARRFGELLDRLARDRAASRAVWYVEQPMSRERPDSTDESTWRELARRTPILLDEGLASFGALAEIERIGLSGAALKTCKGHSFSLVAAAWCRPRGLAVALQDLTNPGLAACHAAWFGAFVPTLNGVELNSPQFTPAANAEWLPRCASWLEPRDGVHRLPAETPLGLGSDA